MLKLYPSDPLFADWDALLTSYAMVCNPSCYFGGVDVDVEYLAILAEWKGM